MSSSATKLVLLKTLANAGCKTFVAFVFTEATKKLSL